ncbi:MAG: SRPBCC domain-containing protein [bacterium]|nr:SRPBCC domain-containing protein [bacterium]
MLKTGVLGVWIVLLAAVGLIGPQGYLYGQPKKKKVKKMEQKAGEKKLYMTTGLMIRKAVIVAASADDVWRAWTTVEGVKSFFAPEASLDLAVGGEYEMYFDPKQPKGLRGSEGCKILTFVPGEVLSFTWNGPPSIPEVRNEQTWVVLTFHAVEGNKTQVSLIHLGWRAGEEWQKALKYFDKAWELVLGRLQYRFKNGPINWKSPPTFK